MKFNNVLKSITLAAALVVGGNSFAQNLTLGVTGGYNMTTYEVADFAPLYNGWNAGLTGVWSNTEKWGIGADVTYTRSGGTYTQFSDDRSSVMRYDVQTDFVRITPKFHYFFGDLEDNFRPTVFIGPSVGILARAENLSNTAQWSNDFRPVELSGVVGAGAKYQIATGLWLGANVNYTVGITQMNDQPVVFPENLRTNNLGVNVGLAYAFNRL